MQQSAWQRLLQRRSDLKRLRLDEAIADGTFAAVKKGGADVRLTKKGKGTKIMLLVDREGTPLAVDITSASRNEVTLIELLLELRVINPAPERLLYDKAADSDPLRLHVQRIELICWHRSNRVRPPIQDGRAARRLSRRWRVEHTIAWLQTFHRLVTRYEYRDDILLGFVTLACMFITLRRF